MNAAEEGAKLNFQYLTCLILDVGTHTLRSFLEEKYLTTGDLQTFLNSKKKKISRLHRRNVINQRQMELLLPSNGSNPVLKDFDISLVSILLTNLCSIAQPLAGWAVPPAANDTSTGADILRLRRARNELYAHRAHSSMDDATFQNEWKYIVDTVSRLSNQLGQHKQDDIKYKIANIQTAPISFNQIFHTNLDILRTLEAIRPNTFEVISSGDEDDATDAEIPQGPDGIICVLKEYPKLKSDLPRDRGEAIAKHLLKAKLISSDEYDKITDSSHTRRVCIDRLLKMVVQGNSELIDCFFNNLREQCPCLAIALSEREVTEDDRKNFKEIEEYSDGNRIQLSHIFDEWDISFLQDHLCDSPEVVDGINDELLSQFLISTWKHSMVTYCRILNDMIGTFFEITQSCHPQVESVLQNKLKPALLQRWTNFRNGTLHRKVLKTCLPVLETDLKFESVFALLRRNKLLDESLCSDISSKDTKEDKTRTLLRCILQKDRSVYEKFKEFLVQSRQSRLKNVLEEEEAKRPFWPRKGEQSGDQSTWNPWRAFLQWINSALTSIGQWFGNNYKMTFKSAHLGSIVLIFGASVGFEINLLNQSDVQISLEKLIRKGCFESKIKVDGPVYVTVCIVSPGHDGRYLDIQFHLDFEAFDFQKESKECHELKLLVEELNPSQLLSWIFNQLKIGSDTKVEMQRVVSNRGLSRRKKMRCLLDLIIKLENWREILKRFCEKNDRYVYEKMFRESNQMPSKEEIGISPNMSYKKGGGLQKLYSMWININEDQGLPEEDLFEKIKLHEENQPDKSCPGDDKKENICSDSEAGSGLTSKVHREDQLKKGNLADEGKVNKLCKI